jgi:hypothetical protein
MKARKMRWSVHLVRVREKKTAYSILVAKSEGQIPLGRSRHRWKDNINMYPKEIG